MLKAGVSVYQLRGVPNSSEPNRESKGQLQNNLLIITSKLYRLYFSI